MVPLGENDIMGMMLDMVASLRNVKVVTSSNLVRRIEVAIGIRLGFIVIDERKLIRVVLVRTRNVAGIRLVVVLLRTTISTFWIATLFINDDLHEMVGTGPMPVI